MAIKNLADIEKALGLESGQFAELIQSEEEHEIDLSSRVIMPKDDFDSRIQNERKEGGKAAVEIAIKKARNEMGLEFEGKTMDNLLNAVQDKVKGEFSQSESERLTKYKADLEAVQKNYSSLQTEYESFKNQAKQEAFNRDLDTKILSSLPDLSIPKEDALILFKSKHTFENDEDGNLVIKDRSGNLLQDDTTRNNLGLSDVLNSFSESYKKVDSTPKPTGGKGGGNSHGNFDAGSLEAFDEEMKERGVTKEEYNSEMSKRISEGTLKV